MDILYLLIPLSVVLAFAIIGVFAWAVKSGQFEDIEGEGERILDAKPPDTTGAAPPVDARQDRTRTSP
jgi:cbb3-type cytochrome oxidase maturation protein